MPCFSIQFDFVDLLTGAAPPQATDLLFFNQEARHRHESQHYARGWVQPDGNIVLIGANWKPTHYALVPDFYAACQQAQLPN